MTYEEKKERIKELLDSLPESTLVDVYNEYNSRNHYPPIYRMDELDEYMDWIRPSEVLRMCRNIDIYDPYFTDYGGLKSHTDVYSLGINVADVVEYILDGNNLGNSDVNNLLNELEDEES